MVTHFASGGGSPAATAFIITTPTHTASSGHGTTPNWTLPPTHTRSPWRLRTGTQQLLFASSPREGGTGPKPCIDTAGAARPACTTTACGGLNHDTRTPHAGGARDSLRAGNSYLKPIFHFICSICSKNRFLIEFAPPESFLLDQKTYLFDQKTYFEMPQPLGGEDEVLIALPSTVGVPGCGMQHAAPTLRYLRGPHAVGRFLGGRPSRAQWLLNPCRAP